MNRIHFLRTAALALMTAAALPMTSSAAEDGPVYELRIYVCNEGKLPALLERFRDHTVKLFEKHGITNIGYWTPIKPEDGADTTLMYVLKHASREAAKVSFAAFGQDPEWKAALKASEAGGKILAEPPQSIFLKVMDYSPVIEPAVKAPRRTFELRIYETPEGKVAPLHERFRNHTVKLFEKHGMENVGYWEPMDVEKGAGSMLVYVLAHKSQEAGLASFDAFRADPVWVAAKAASEEKNGGSLTLPQPEGVRSIYMQSVDFSPMK
jgi:hypothetical protein